MGELYIMSSNPLIGKWLPCRGGRIIESIYSLGLISVSTADSKKSWYFRRKLELDRKYYAHNLIGKELEKNDTREKFGIWKFWLNHSGALSTIRIEG